MRYVYTFTQENTTPMQFLKNARNGFELYNIAAGRGAITEDNGTVIAYFFVRGNNVAATLKRLQKAMNPRDICVKHHASNTLPL